VMDIKLMEAIYTEVKGIVDKHELTCWLTGGTALGAYRDGSIIPYDHDIDIRVLPTEWDRVAMKKDLEGAGFRYVDSIEPRIYGDLYSGAVAFKHGLRIDFDLLYYYPPENLVCSLSHIPQNRCVLSADFYRGDHFIDFIDSSVRIPYPAEEFLEFLYGKDWRIPDKSHFTTAKWYVGVYKRISMVKYIEYFHTHPKLNQLGSGQAWK